MDFANRSAVCDALKRLRQPVLGIDGIYLWSLHHRRDCRPCFAAAVTASEETVFFCMIACGLIVRSTTLEPIYARPSYMRGGGEKSSLYRMQLHLGAWVLGTDANN